VTVSRPNMTEKLDRLIDDMRLLRAQMIGLDRQMIGLDRQMKGIEAYLKRNEPSEQPSSKMRPSLAAAACSHWLPDGSLSVLLGRHGAMNPAGRARCSIAAIAKGYKRRVFFLAPLTVLDIVGLSRASPLEVFLMI
jgi:hypothetical protein